MPARALRPDVRVIGSLVLEDGEEEGRDYETRSTAVDDHPAEEVPTESDPLGPMRAPIKSACVLPIARAVTNHRLWRLLKDVSGKGCGCNLLDRESALL